MRLLVDNALSPTVAGRLREAGFDAVHVRERGIQHADDATIFAEARATGAVIVTADADFGELLARQRTSTPSVILLAGRVANSPGAHVDLIIDAASRTQRDLESGAVVVVEPGRIRIRPLPIGSD